MTSRSGWLRVSRSRPCAICERPDWCLIATDGRAAICARIESHRRIGEAGWLHRLRNDSWRPARRIVRSINVAPATSTRADLAEMAAACQSAARPEGLGQLANSLGLSAASLRQLAIGWSSQFRAWTFPMVDASGNVMGIRLRRSNGFKFAVPGSKDGLFIPKESETEISPLLVAEGATDVAALWDMGFRHVVGRPSCAGGAKLLVELVRDRQPRGVVIVPDGDEPGKRGADNLATVLAVYSAGVLVIQLPEKVKDARAWLRAGGNRHDVEKAISAAPVRRVSMITRRVR